MSTASTSKELVSAARNEKAPAGTLASPTIFKPSSSGMSP
jgi:hypothetical protein